MALRYGHRLRRYFSVHLRNACDVPDLAQEVYLRLLRVDHEEAIRNPEAYLFTIASHVVRQYAVRQAAADRQFVDITDTDAMEGSPELVLPPGEEPHARAENSERLEWFQTVLKNLPPRMGAAVALHRIGGYTVEEVANELGMTREAVKKTLTRAAERCRKAGYGARQGE